MEHLEVEGREVPENAHQRSVGDSAQHDVDEPSRECLGYIKQDLAGYRASLASMAGDCVAKHEGECRFTVRHHPKNVLVLVNSAVDLDEPIVQR